MLLRAIGRLAQVERARAAVAPDGRRANTGAAAPGASSAGATEMGAGASARRVAAEARVAAALSGRPVVRRAIFARVLRQARARVQSRENLPFERTRVFGRVRRIFVEAGRRLAAEDRLAAPEDVFYLEVAEVLGIVEGTVTTASLGALAEARRAEFDRYRHEPAPADRFETRGAVWVGNRFTPSRPPVALSDDERRGGARQRALALRHRCSRAGIARGRVAAGPHVVAHRRRPHRRRRHERRGAAARTCGRRRVVSGDGRSRASLAGAAAPAVAARADFTAIRYAQCWEDADVLVEALAPQSGQTLVSIASAGDNTLALLIGRPARVLAVDLNPAQLACLALRVAAYRELSHAELLELVGSRASTRRRGLYARCRPQLASDVRAFWDAHGDDIDRGIGGAGKFERYFETFRRRVLPLVHASREVERLLAGGPAEVRERFYRDTWDTWRWRLMFHLFFSRTVMGRLGRDPAFLTHVEGSVASRILARTRHALTALDPAANPYMHWILRGTHGEALPLALRPEHFETIRDHVDRVEWRQCDLGAALDVVGPGQVHGCNVSDIFEYMSVDEYHAQLERLVTALASSGRRAYWNTLAPRARPESMADRLRPLDALAERLHLQDKALFYRAFVVEERC